MADTMRAALAGAGYRLGEPAAPPDSKGGHPSWLSSRYVGASGHAVERYRERFEPGLDADQAKLAIYGLLEIATFSRRRPRWLINVSSTSEKDDALGWVLVEDEIAMPLLESHGRPTRQGHYPFQPFYVVTCLARLAFDGEARSSPSWRGHDPTSSAPADSQPPAGSPGS